MKLLIIAALLACSAAHAEQTRDCQGRMVHIYNGTPEESIVMRNANYEAAKFHRQGRNERMQRLHSKLALF